MKDEDLPVLQVKEIKLEKTTRRISSIDNAFPVKTDEEEIHGKESCTYDCDVKIGSVVHKFLQIGSDKTIEKLYCHHKSLLREHDRIVAVNNTNVDEMSAEEVAKLLNSYCQKNNSQSTEFILKIHRTEAQHIEEVKILFRITTTHTRRENGLTFMSDSPQPRVYMRDVIRAIDKRSKKDIVIKTKLREGEQQYLTVTNGRICADFITSAAQIDHYAFTVRQYTVIYRLENGKEKVKGACTIWWKDLCLVGSNSGELRLQMPNNASGPNSESLFRIRKTTTGCAFESVKYMYYYIHFNPEDNTVSFEQKRPTICNGQTRKTSPADCKFRITEVKMLSSDDDTKSVFCALTQPFLACLKR